MLEERIYRREFWLGGFDARRLALFRIVFASVVLWDILERLRDFHTFYTDAGMFPRTAVFHGPWWVSARWSLFAATGDPRFVGLIYAAGIAALIALVFGYRTRLATIASWIFVLSLQRRLPDILDGADAVEAVLLFWLSWADAGAQLSLDVALGRRPLQASVPALPVRLIQLQIAAVYFFTALSKSDISWYNGAALGRVLRMAMFARPTTAWLLQLPAVCKVLSIAIPPSEAAIAILMFTPWRRARYAALAAAIALHGSILLFMNVGMFSIVMPAAMTIALPGGVPRSDGRRRWWSLVPALLMTLVLASLALLPWNMALPLPLVRVLEAAGLVQSWQMFGADPGGLDFSWRAPAQLADGTTVDDVLPQLAPKLSSRRSYLTYARWLKLREAMWRPEPRTLVATYLCRRYVATERRPLRSLDLLVTARYLTAYGTTSSERTTKLLHQECSPTPNGGDGAR